MTYTLRLRDGDAWLSLMNEKGEFEQFPTFAAAMIRGKSLLSPDSIREFEIRGAPQPTRVYLNDLDVLCVRWDE